MGQRSAEGASRPVALERPSPDDRRRAPSPAERQALLRRGLGAPVPESLLRAEGRIDDAESITRLLRTLLRKQILRVDTKIRGEFLGEAFGVHRNTISKVLRTLESEGYLHRRKGRPALVTANDPPTLPRRRTHRISHTKIAEEHRLDIRTVPVRCESQVLQRLALRSDEKAEISSRLALPMGASVIVYSRIRELRAESGEWRPAIAETAYFAESRAPKYLLEALAGGNVESIHRYLAQNGIAPITSEYRIGVTRLPETFVGPWAKLSGVDPRDVRKEPFLRFESTTHGPRGPIELSIASLPEGLFTIGTTDLSLSVETAMLYAPGLPRFGILSA